MKRRIIQTYFLMIMMLTTIAISNGFAYVKEDTMSMESLPQTVKLKKEISTNAYLTHTNSHQYDQINIPSCHDLLMSDTIFQVTSSSGEEAHPSLVIDSNDNPFILYDYNDFPENPDSDIFIQRSFDGGKTWDPNDIWVWDSPDTYDFHPDISIMADGLRAYGTHEVDVSEPTMYLHDYVNVNLPESWVMYVFDLAPECSYVKDTAIATYGVNTIALAGVVDFSYHEYDLEDTIVIFWNTQMGMDTWPGLYLINTDSEGNTQPLSHISADAGDKVFVVYESESVEGETDIYVAYCPSTELLFEKWRILKVSRSDGNVINPDISVSGKYAYVVCQDDEKGNQDIICYTSTSGHYWRETVIANSFSDETNPVITADGQRASCLFIRNGNLYESKTENGGIDWSEPIQINDIDGTVVDGYRAIDSKGIYGAWTDTRDNNQDIYISEVGPAPLIEVDTISFSYKIKVAVTNYGSAPEENVRWSIETDGFAIPESKKGLISSIQVGETEEFQTDFFFGFGPISVTITVGHIVIGVNGIGMGPILFPNV